MGRLVDARPPGVKVFSSTNDRDVKKKQVQDYLERVAKYVPAEILAAYLTLLSIVTGSTKDGTTFRTVLYAVIAGGCLVLTPCYLNYMAEAGQPKRVHLIIGSIAFVIWVYAIGGIFTDIGIYQAAISAILIIFFSLISGLIIPTTGTP